MVHATIAGMRSMGCRRHVAVVLGVVVGVVGLTHPAGATFPGANGRLAVSTPAYKSVTQGCLARGQLHLIAPDGSGHEQITDDRGLRFASPQWSPDSARLTADVEILDRCLNRVYVIDVATRSYHEVPCGFECFGGAWTADGSRLLVTPSGILGTTINSIYSITPDGSDLRLLVAAAPGTRLGDATASADGRHIAYTHEGGGATIDGANSSVMIAGADGTNPRRVGAGAGAEFSPDSTRLLYTSTDPADGGLAPVVSDLQGGGRTRVAPAANLRATALSWSPDGTQILVGVASPLEQKNTVLAVRAPLGTQAHPPGATSPGCLLGYRIVIQGDLDGATWSSSGPVAGQGATPADVPCPAAPPPVPLPTPASSGLRASISNRRGELRVKVQVSATARGRIVVRATQLGRSLSRRGLAGRQATRVYRFAIRRSGTVKVSVRFVGRTGWASKQLRTRKVRKVLPARA